MSKPGASNGYEIVRGRGLKCVLGTENAYRWQTRTVVLTPDVAAGTDARSQIVALHECAHAQQPRHWWFLRIFEPFRWWMEVDAWRRAVDKEA